MVYLCLYAVSLQTLFFAPWHPSSQGAKKSVCSETGLYVHINRGMSYCPVVTILLAYLSINRLIT